ncbi:MAG: glycosyltransferase family 2 protein [Endomicrobiales bacterium]|nr:glycosyltransferase family 2 protein [Endomicrobiales bacterium]
MSVVKSKVSVIIPVYNEEKFIEMILLKVCDRPEISEIIVVDDGSSDETYEKAEGILRDHQKILLKRLPSNRGKGVAIREGLKFVTGDIVIIQDADLEYDPNDYEGLLQPFNDNGIQVVYGSRMLKKQHKISYLSYAIGGIFLTFLTNMLYFSKLTDEATGYKVFRTAVLRGIDLQSKRFEFCPEITAKLLRKKIHIVEVPISYNPRKFEEGKKIRLRDGLMAVWILLKYRIFL